MNDLVKLIVSQTGLDEKMAKQVVQVVVGFLEKNLPAPLNKQVEKLLSGQITDISQLVGGGQGGGLLGKLLGMFGGRKK